MFSPGRLIYHLYHRPLSAIREAIEAASPKNKEAKAGREAMQQASFALEERTGPGGESLTVYFLTGKKYWYQTAFCLHSLQRVAGVTINAVLVDDGSFDEDLAARIKQQFPKTVSLVWKTEIESRLERILPPDRFPTLRSHRLVYPHLRKLTDVHTLADTGPKLVLDSDMLFFHQPQALLAWLREPAGLLFMRDVQESYGHPVSLLKSLAGVAHFPERLNVGVAGLFSADIDWAQMEYFNKELLTRGGASYYHEQALTALLAAKNSCTFLDGEAYKVLPRIVGTQVPEVLHHYVAEAKHDYFVKGWRLVLQEGGTKFGESDKTVAATIEPRS